MSYKTTIFFADLGLLWASAIWGTTFFIVKDALKYIDPIALCAYRFLFSGLILLIFLLYKKKSLFSNLKEGLILGFILWAIYIAQTIGLVYTTASNAAFITGLFVAFIPIFSLIIFKKPPTIPQLIAVILSLVGLWILTGGINEINLGDLITILTAIAYALHVLFTDKFVKNNIEPAILCFQQFIFVSLLSFICMLFFKLPFSINKINVYWIIFYLTIFPTLIAFLVQTVCQKITSPIKVSLIFALEPLFGAIFAWTLGGEPFIFTQAIGGLLIIFAIVSSEFKLDHLSDIRYQLQAKRNTDPPVVES